MPIYLLICRSLTYSQRAMAALRREGISASIYRIPQEISQNGCGYSVKIKQTDLTRALVILKNAGLSPIRIYSLFSDGSVTEVTV